MSKYDIELDMNSENSLSIIANIIDNNSIILEFGPAHGRLTKYLKEDKNCTIDIVELDEEAGRETACFARCALVGEIDGNIENYMWLEKLKNNKYDYIIFADVLEHLYDPEKALLKSRSLLKEEGKVLISIPNICHDSILINMYNNRFAYTETGLLDNTHIRFWGLKDIEEFAKKSGFEISELLESRSEEINTEQAKLFDNDWNKIKTLIQGRPYGDTYQFIIVLTADKGHKYDFEYKKICQMNLFYDTGNGFNSDEVISDKVVMGEHNRYSFIIDKNIKSLRLDPVERCWAKITDLLIKINDVDAKIMVISEDQISLEDSTLFFTEDPIYNIEIPMSKSNLGEFNIEIEYKADYVDIIEDSNFKNEELKIENEKLETEKAKSEIENAKLEKENTKLETEKLILQESIENIRVNMSNKLGHIELLLQSERDLKNSEIYLKNELSKERKNRIDFENELERIKGSRSWKLMTYIWKIAPQGSKRRLVAKITLKFIKMPLVGLSKLNKKNIKKFFYYLKKEGVKGVSKRLDNSFITIENEKLKIEIQKLQSNKGIEEYAKFSVPRFEMPKVSIIIPVYNQFEYTYNCIKSIVENSKNATYEIIVANDLSADLTTRIEEVISGIKVITNKENLRFLKNCNNAAKDANGEYILFLNNDTQVQENWLMPLIDLIESKKDIGMVGSKLVYPDGRLQEAGGILWADGSAWNYGHGQEPEKPEFNYVKEVDYISGASIMIKKELWDAIGGFDERFAPAYYEDSDLSFEVRKHGYKVMFQPKSVVVHFEGASNGTDTNSGQKSYQVANQKKFFEKWKKVLEKEHFENGENVFWARDRSKNKKTILVIDHYIPNYDKDAGGKNTYLYIKLYLKMGLKVVFLGDNFFRQQPYADELEQLGVEILYGSYYQKNWKQWIIENDKHINYAYLNRPHIAEKYIDILRKKTNSKIIYFGHDLHYLRELRQYEIEGDSTLLESSKAWKKKEFDLFDKADVIYVVGNYEQKYLMEEIKDKPIRNIPVFYYDKIEHEQKYEFANRRNFLFVGGFGHKPNEDAVLWFAKEIFPTIEQEIKDIKWYIVGSNPTEEVKALAKNNIIVTGFISDEELSELYRSCKLAIAPLRYGAGVKGKVVEAVYNGIPLVTTQIGAEGLDTNIGAFLVLEPDKDMGKAIITLYYDEEALVKIVSRSRVFINKYFTEKIAEKIILLDVEV